MPTLFILLAPPAVGFIAYMRITQSWDVFSALLLNIMLFFVVLLFFLRKSFYGIKFFISWWAFTFPLTATTVALAVAFQVTAQPVFKYASWVMFVFTLMVISFVSWHTILKIKQRQICINED